MDLAKYRRIAQALAESQRLNAELEARVRQKQRELERQFEALQALTREAAIAEERQRLMADMHDGIGGQLIAALALAEGDAATAPALAAMLRDCIDDLRLTIDSLDATDCELLPALGNFRYRIERRLQGLGIALVWQVQDLPPLPWLSPRTLLHVMRILQEAFANVMKHAGARRVVVEALPELERRQVLLRVGDDGRGIDAGRPAGSGRGRGLGNMARRAAALGGELRIVPGAPGTTVELRLPLG